MSILLVCIIVWYSDPRKLAGQIREADRYALLATTALLLLLVVPAALRWSAVLQAMGHPAGLRTTTSITLSAEFFNQTLPSTIGGDAIRIWEACREGLSSSVAISSVLIDRAVGLAALCLLVTATFPWLIALHPPPVLIIGVLLTLVAGYFGLAAAMLLDCLPRAFTRLKVISALSSISGQLRSLIVAPKQALVVLGLTFIYQIGAVLAVFLLADGLNLAAPPIAYLIVVPLANLSTLVPISIAGWGVREVAFVVGFGLVDIAAADAVALSVLFGFLNMVVGLIGGVVWLLRRSRPQDSPP